MKKNAFVWLTRKFEPVKNILTILWLKTNNETDLN